jgi:uncharacterized protein (DUF58 family)
MELDTLLERAHRLELKSRFLARSHYSGLYQSAFRGLGMEFAEVREYAEGDDVRLIDWNVSARSQSLYVKRMVEERERNVLLILDTTGSLRFGSVQRTKFDLLMELAALFILSGFHARDKISLAIIKGKVERFVPAAKGWNHAARLIRDMVSFEPEGSATDIEPVWSFANSPGIPKSLVFFMTDFQTPLSPSNAFSAACRKHEMVTVLVSDPRDWELPRVGRVRFRDPESGQVRVVNTSSEAVRREYERNGRERRGEILDILRNNGVDWVEFRTGAEYESGLRRFLERRSLRKGYRYQ